jgi:hypothetical protein
MLLFTIVVWVFLCILVGVAAEHRFNRSSVWCLIAVVISPLLAILLLLALGPAKPEPPDEEAVPDWRPAPRTPQAAWQPVPRTPATRTPPKPRQWHEAESAPPPVQRPTAPPPADDWLGNLVPVRRGERLS